MVSRMRGAGDRLSVGERIAFYRRRRGLTQRVLSGLVGRSEDWLSKVERCEREVRRLDVLADLARALRITVGDLLGQPVLVEDHEADGDDIPAIRDSLMAPHRLSTRLYGDDPVPSVDQRQIVPLVERAWSRFQGGQLADVIRALPDLIRSAQGLEKGDGVGSREWAVSARIHHLAASTLAKVGEADLAWLAAERAMYAADRSDDPLVLASASRAATHALLTAGRYDDALELGITAAGWLSDRAANDDTAAISLLGMLYLRAAGAAARHHDRATANDLLERASQAAARLGRDLNLWQTAFGPTNVELHRLSAALDLGDVAHVVDRAPLIEVDHLPLERAVSHHIDTARAQSLLAQDDAALASLLTAEVKAPHLVRHSATVREAVRAMHRRAPVTGGAKSSRLLALAERCRAV